MNQRKMERFSSSVVLIMAFSRAFELRLVAGLAHHELACPSQGDLPFRDNGLQSQKKPAIGHWASQFILFRGIQNRKELNGTCCLNGRTCILGSFCTYLSSLDGTVSLTCMKESVWFCAPWHLVVQEVFDVYMLAWPASLDSSVIPTWLWWSTHSCWNSRINTGCICSHASLLYRH